MNLAHDSSEPRKERLLPSGDKLLLLEVLGKTALYPKEEQNRNIFLLNSGGRLVWRVAYHEGIRGHDPFVGVGLREDGKIIGGTWEGWDFEISLADGSLTKLGWTK